MTDISRRCPFPCHRTHVVCICSISSGQQPGPSNHKILLGSQNTQLSLGLPDPRQGSSLPILKQVLAGVSRACLGQGQPSRVRLPVTDTLLGKIGDDLVHVAHPERPVLWAVCCTAFFGFFRLGELLLTNKADFNPRLHLAWGDMAVDNLQAPRLLKFHLKQTKRDPFGRRADIILGRTGCTLCPVAAVLSFVAMRGSQQGPFFVTSAGDP